MGHIMDDKLIVRLKAKQKRAIKRHAASKGLSISAFIRMIAIKAIKEG